MRFSPEMLMVMFFGRSVVGLGLEWRMAAKERETEAAEMMILLILAAPRAFHSITNLPPNSHSPPFSYTSLLFIYHPQSFLCGHNVINDVLIYSNHNICTNSLITFYYAPATAKLRAQGNFNSWIPRIKQLIIIIFSLLTMRSESW